MKVTVEEMRSAVNTTYPCEVTKLVSSEKVTCRHGDSEDVIDVYLFDICGHPHASQCYVWADVVDSHLTVIPVVLRTPRLSTADRAVVTYSRKSSNKRRRHLLGRI